MFFRHADSEARSRGNLFSLCLRVSVVKKYWSMG